MTTPIKPLSAPKMAVRTAIILLVFVVIFTGLLAAAYLGTRPAIEAAAAKALQQRAFHSITELEDGTRLELIAIGETTDMNQGGDWMKIPANAGKLGQAAAIISRSVPTMIMW